MLLDDKLDESDSTKKSETAALFTSVGPNSISFDCIERLTEVIQQLHFWISIAETLL